MRRQKIYVILTQTNTILASTIRMMTGARYSHVSMSFEKECYKMYSFGRKHYYIPMYGVFKEEDIRERIFAGREDNYMAVYSLSVTSRELRQIARNVKKIERANDGFNILGLAAAAFNIKLNRNKYYCAEFVHEAINDKTRLLEETLYPVKPEDIIGMNERFELEYEGTIRDYIEQLNNL